MTVHELTEKLRRRIVADLHLGRLRPGSRLPSLRTVAREQGVSIRAAARAYAVLERDGLVSVRGRSGIYLVLPPSVDVELEAPLDWYAEMLKQAWLRRITITDVNHTLQRLVAEPMTVACVESTDDHMVAFCAELEADFALRTVSVKLTPDGARVGDESMTLYDALAGVDFAVTTAFHAVEVHAAADPLKKPVVILSVSDALVSALAQQLAHETITIVADDQAFVERLRTYVVERFSENGDLRVVSMQESRDDPTILEGTTVLYTRAARRRLNEREYHLLPPPVPFLSAHAARKIVHCMLCTHRDRLMRAA